MDRRTLSPVVLRVLLGLFVVLIGVYGLLFVYHAARLAFARGELNYAEGVWLFSAIRARHGLPMYFDYAHAPYIAMVYPPLDPGIAGLISSGLSLSDEGVVVVARLLTLAATLASAGAVYVLARRLGASLWPALLGALLFLTPSHTYALWSFVARADMLAVAVGVWGVAVLAWRPKGWGLAAAGALCALAVCTKQTAVAPLLASAWWLLPADRRRGLPMFAGGVALGFVVGLAPLGIGGVGMLLRHTLDLVGEPWTRGPLYARMNDLLSLVGVLMPLAVVGLVKVVRMPEGRLVARYLVLSSVVLVVSAGKVGSASSYCLETIAVLCVLCALGVQWLVDYRPARRMVLAGAAVVVFGLLAAQSAQAALAVQMYDYPNADDHSLLADVSKQGGLVYSEDGYVTLHGVDPPYMLDPFYFSALAARGKWDPADICRMLSERRFSAVVLIHPVDSQASVQGVSWEPQGVDAAVSANYTLLDTPGRYYVYVPKR